MNSMYDGEVNMNMNMKGGGVTTNGSGGGPKEYDKITLKIVPGQGIQKTQSVPLSKTKGIHGSLQRQSSEFDNFEDRIIPTGSKVIDIGYLLAPSPSDNNDNNNDVNDNVTDTKAEEDDSSPPKLDIHKKRELDRLIQAQEEVDAYKAYNIKRRSLKERLSEMSSMSLDSFDHGIVPYKSVTPDAVEVQEADLGINKYAAKTPPESPESPEDSRSWYFDGYKPKKNASEPALSATAKNDHQPAQHVGSMNDDSDGNQSDSDEESDISSPDKSVESIVERFDAFLTDHGIADPDVLSPLAPSVTGDVLKAAALIDVIDDAIEDLEERKVSDTEEQDQDEEDYLHNKISFSDEVVDLSSNHDSYLGSEGDASYHSSLQTDSLPSAENSLNNGSTMLYEPPLENGAMEVNGHNNDHTEPLPDEESPVEEYLVEASPEEEEEEEEEEEHSEDEAGIRFSQGLAEVVLPTKQMNTTVKVEEISSPKKSNLTKTESNKPKKVNFRDPTPKEVIFTYGPNEYDRANADIDPIASSAEWELEKRVDKMDVFSVDLQKDERGLGLSIIGLGVGTETGVEKLGIFVKTLTENGASEKDGRIQVNDQILEVNGTSLVGVTQYFAAQTLKNTDGVVRFLMGREKSRRTQYAPGAAIAANPDMHKHIEEMNQVLQQLEDAEERASNAEQTLEDVKIELLKAEERAHKAEDELKDTHEQLTVATQSPFIGSSKKLKNEIKKNGVNVDTNRKVKELETENERLQTQIADLNETMKAQSEDRLQAELKMQREHGDAIKQLEDDMSKNKSELESSLENVATLTEKNDYLQSLIVKLQTKQEAVPPPEEDLETKFLEKEEEYIREADALRARIAELEQQVAAYGSMMRTEASPVLPSRGYVNLRDVTDHVLPPQVSRNTKPCAKIEPSTRTPIEQQESCDNQVASDLNINASPPNPIPKPERGHFVAQIDTTLQDNDGALTDEESSSDQLLYPIPNSSISGSLILPTIPTTKTPTKPSPALNVDLDALPEGRIDSESVEDDVVDDEGQFELVCEEDIDEDSSAPLAIVSASRTQRVSVDNTELDLPSASAQLPDNLIADNQYNTFDKWLGGLDTISRDQQADIIAAHVAAGTPVTRDYSNRSSLSSEDTPDRKPPRVDDDPATPRISLDMSVDDIHQKDSEVIIDDVDEPLSSLDAVVPPTQVLENKSALDKKAVKNNRRSKPSRSPRAATPPRSPELPKTMSVDTTTLPQPPISKKPTGKIKAAQSVPNLSFVPDDEGKTKRKYKYVFNLPKAFRKKKTGKRQESFEGGKSDVPSSGAMSFSDPELSPPPLARTISDPALHTPGNDCASVVPIEQKVATMSQEKANDAATEEAVVPFADVEMIMNSHEVESEKSSLSGGCSPPSAGLHPESSPSISSRSLSNSHYENRLSSYPTAASDNEFSPSPVGSISPEVYNERGIDVDMTAAPTISTDYKHAPVTQWTFSQVGQWLSDTNMGEYVNAFRLHNVNGAVLLRADGRDLKEYGVVNQDHRALLKKHIKDFRNKFGKSPVHKTKDHKSTKDRLQFWKGKYKINQ